MKTGSGREGQRGWWREGRQRESSSAKRDLYIHGEDEEGAKRERDSVYREIYISVTESGGMWPERVVVWMAHVELCLVWWAVKQSEVKSKRE